MAGPFPRHQAGVAEAFDRTVAHVPEMFLEQIGNIGSGTGMTIAKPPRRFPAPWQVVVLPGGYAVEDATGQRLATFYGRADPSIGPLGGRADAGRGAAHGAEFRQAAGTDQRFFAVASGKHNCRGARSMKP